MNRNSKQDLEVTLGSEKIYSRRLIHHYNAHSSSVKKIINQLWQSRAIKNKSTFFEFALTFKPSAKLKPHEKKKICFKNMNILN
ncbi:hypothetical protein BpHYR1_001318 [Brachionus plicatilis]|uniref:Uncharacterized protein n=1 Tax=Brachionus plicatilis TaxID=10195 RepID=A0A3M7T7B7_BRAPC|nr:hypothetical protein BpHYR1_001318 [Brachionus plicatilis]